MELRFIPPDLRRLDMAASEVLVLPLFADLRPPRGVAGLIDYRLAGHISSLLRRGTIAGEPLEQLLVRGRPKLPFDKILLVGCGATFDFNPQVFSAVVDVVLAALSQLGVRRAVVELPGRASNLIAPELAADILLQRAELFPEFDVWTLIDHGDAARLVNQGLRRDRQRDWGASV